MFPRFDNNKPDALSTDNRKCTKCIIFDEHSDLGAKNVNNICLKIVQKVLKWPLQYVHFPGEYAPGPP